MDGKREGRGKAGEESESISAASVTIGGARWDGIGTRRCDQRTHCNLEENNWLTGSEHRPFRISSDERQQASILKWIKIHLKLRTEQPTLVRDMRLTWTDVAHLFPPQQDVERLLEYFLEDMVFIMIPIQEKQLWPAWLRLIQSPSSPSGPLDEDAEEERRQGQGISRCMVGSLLMCLVSVSFLIRKGERSNSDSRDLRQNREMLGLRLRWRWSVAVPSFLLLLPHAVNSGCTTLRPPTTRAWIDSG